MAHQNSKKWR